jgi:hypothetical protein
MFRHAVPMLLPVLLLPAGCVFDEAPTQMVSDNPFGAPAQKTSSKAAPTAAPPAATQVAAQVDTLGRMIIAKNSQAGVQPLFRTVGTPQLEIFHKGTTEIVISEGLVRQCKTDAELAALLCMELGRMVSEREALAAPWRRNMERELPPDVHFPGDNGADRTQLAELGKYYEADRKRSIATKPLPPDPQVLARGYLTKAGFVATDLDAVASLLRGADSNGALQKQITPPPAARPWTQ